MEANFKQSKPEQEKEKGQDSEGRENSALMFTDLKGGDYFEEAVVWGSIERSRAELRRRYFLLTPLAPVADGDLFVAGGRRAESESRGTRL